jgi:hypothetical protein
MGFTSQKQLQKPSVAVPLSGQRGATFPMPSSVTLHRHNSAAVDLGFVRGYYQTVRLGHSPAAAHSLIDKGSETMATGKAVAVWVESDAEL